MFVTTGNASNQADKHFQHLKDTALVALAGTAGSAAGLGTATPPLTDSPDRLRSARLCERRPKLVVLRIQVKRRPTPTPLLPRSG